MRLTLAIHLMALLFGFSSCGKVPSEGVCSQERVLKHIFTNRNYFRSLRPGAGADPVKVSYRLEIIRLSGFDVNTKILCMDVRDNIEYTDPRLTWNAANCNVGSIRQPRTRVWTPDLEVYGITAAAPDLVNQPLVTIDNTGKVQYVEAKKFKTFCNLPNPVVDGEYNCTLTVGSFAYGCSDLILEVADAAGGVSMKHYIGPPLQKGQPWKIVSIRSSAHSFAFECCPDPFCVIDYTITLRYNTLYS